MKIQKLILNKIIDSNAGFALEAEITLQDGSIGIYSVPGGISKGINECFTLEPEKAIKFQKQLNDKLTGMNFEQSSLDDYLIKLDGTKDKSNLGGNLILAVSGAFLKARALSLSQEPYQLINKIICELAGTSKFFKFKRPDMFMLILEGGLHGSGKASMQEFMAVVNRVEDGIVVYNKVKEKLKKNKLSINVGAEGAFSPEVLDNISSLELLSSCLKNQTIALDVAGNSFIELKEELPDYQVILDDFPVISIEDPYPESDIKNWQLFSKKYSRKINVVTDDLTVTNHSLLSKALKLNIGNTIIIKPNQIGSFSEVFKVITLAKESGWETIVSHRGTDTNEDLVADLAIGTGSEYVKFGAPARGERVSKYNRLNKILRNLNL